MLGFLYGVLGVFVGMFFYFAGQFLPMPLSFFQRTWMIFFTPVFYFFIGAIIGALFALTYNVLSTVFGGIKVRVRH